MNNYRFSYNTNPMCIQSVWVTLHITNVSNVILQFLRKFIIFILNVKLIDIFLNIFSSILITKNVFFSVYHNKIFSNSIE